MSTHLDDLAFFQKLATHGSLTGVALELGLSLPAVSKRLAQMEKRLGVQLAQRTTRRLTLTPEGNLYLEMALPILADLAELEAAVTHRQAHLNGLLRVNATLGFGRRHIAPITSDFRRLHPDVKVQLELSHNPQNLTESGIDIGIRVGAPPDSRLIAHRLTANRRVVCAAPSYLAEYGTPQSVAELAQHACIILREIDNDYATWRLSPSKNANKAATKTMQSIKVKGPLSSNDGEVVKQWAIDGHGLILRSVWDVQADLEAGRLVRVLPELEGPNADFYAVYQQRRHVSARIRAYVKFLAENLAVRMPSPE